MLVNRFEIIHLEMYYCNIDTNLTALKSFQVRLEDNKPYTYTIKQVETTNALGAVIATLDEYFITNPHGENYKLYKTKEGNWYDLPEMIFSANTGILRALKLAIDNSRSER